MKLYGITHYIKLSKNNKYIYLFGERHFMYLPPIPNTTYISNYISQKLRNNGSKLFLELDNSQSVSKRYMQNYSQSTSSPYTLKNIATKSLTMNNAALRNKIDFYNSREKILKNYFSKNVIQNGYYAPFYYSNRIKHLQFRFFEIEHLIDVFVDYYEKSVPSIKTLFAKKLELINAFRRRYANISKNVDRRKSVNNLVTSRKINISNANYLIDKIRKILALLPEMNLLNKLANNAKIHNYILIGEHHVSNIKTALVSDGWSVDYQRTHTNNFVINVNL